MRYTDAIWKGPVPCINPKGMRKVQLGVVHIMQGSIESCDNWFHDEKSQVSAHFGNPKSGEVYQWVDTADKAWAEMDYNPIAISIEHEGDSGEQLTEFQIENLAHLMVWVHNMHGLPIVRTTSPNEPGWIGHGELGVAGGNHPLCPGQPILDQLPDVLAAANQLIFPHFSIYPGFARIIQDSANGGMGLVNLAKKEYYGLNRDAYDYYKTLKIIHEEPGPIEWAEFKQMGTIG